MSDASESPGRAPRALLALSALLFVAIRIPFLSVPLERDEGEYAYIAQRALLGEVPYRDAFDQKPPGIFAIYLAAFRTTGASVEGIHAFLYLWTAATCLLLYQLGRRWIGERTAALATLAFAVASIDPSLAASAANTEIFMLLPVVASTLLLLRALEERRLVLWIGCGALAGAACWIKPVAIGHGVFLAAAGLAQARRDLREATGVVLGLLLGVALVSAPVLATFLALGAWEPFVDAVFLHNLAYTGRVGLLQGVRNALWSWIDQLPSLGVLWLLAGVGAFVARRRLARRDAWLLAGFGLASAVGVSSGLYFRPHYFIQLLPLLAMLAALGAEALAGLRRRGLVPAAVAVALLAGPPLLANRSLLRASPEAISREIYRLNPFVESARIGEYIRKTSQPSDTVYVIGSEPQILFYAERRSASRYIFFYPLTGAYANALERQQELMHEVQAADPLYVVWANIPTSHLTGPDSELWVFEASRELVEERYLLEFIARPPERDGGESFDFVYGRRARELLAEAQDAGRPIPWIAVFRRVG